MPSKRYFMNLAIEIGRGSKCKRAKVGCVIVDEDNRCISTGYNGSPINSIYDCEDIHEVTYHSTLHAELNAILFSRRDLNNSTLFVTLSPCLHCAACIVQSGIKCVYYLNEYRSTEGIEFLKSHGVKVHKFISNHINVHFLTLKPT